MSEPLVVSLISLVGLALAALFIILNENKYDGHPEEEEPMAWSLNDIKEAYDRGEAMGATHMIVALDSFDYENYPIYVMPGENPILMQPSNGDRVDECYKYSLGWEAQSGHKRVQNWTMD